MALFIVSEVLFFVRFFWAFFHSRLAPTLEIGSVWPPVGIIPFNPFQVPLLNTIVLLSSGVSVTWAHHALIEYIEASFTFADSVYGSTFYLATGFHGLHVLVGTLFLIVCYVRHLRCEFRVTHHFGFEAAAWYWHFVDVV